MTKYSLVMETFDKQTIKINFLEKNKLTNEVSLKTIDEYTTTTSSREELLKKINSNEKIKSIKITYVIDDWIRQVPLAYNDKNKLNEINFKHGSHIDENNRVFKNTMSKLMELLKKDDFYIYAMESDLLTSKQKEYIEIIFKSVKYNQFNYSKFYSYCNSYRNFRDILFLIEKYEMLVLANQEKKTVIIEEIDDEDDHEDVLFDEDEKKRYQQYLDNLPDNLPPYIDRHL